MADRPLYDLTAHEAADLLARREVSSRQLTEAVLERIRQVEGRIEAFVTVTEELALHQADEADKRLAAGDADAPHRRARRHQGRHLHQGRAHHLRLAMLENFVPPYDATWWSGCCRPALVMVGKANMDEFAMGSSTENSAFFPTHNPWDLERVPGGSSGGSAAAVAAGEAFYALGSDTGGSIRQPAGFCGVVGLKPTYGRVSRYGLVAFASSLDQIGPLTKDVTDCALVMNAIAGHDRRDSTSVPRSTCPTITASLVPDLKGLRLGVPREYFVEGMQPACAPASRPPCARLEELGAEVDWEVSLPSTGYALAVYYIIAPSEASANLARYDGVKYGYSNTQGESMWEDMEKTRQYGFGAEVKRRIMLGTYALSAGYYDAYYLKAQKVRTLIRREFDAGLRAVRRPGHRHLAHVRLQDRREDRRPAPDVPQRRLHHAGQHRRRARPSPSRPASSDGLPVGLQIIGKPFGEETILRVAYAYEQATDWHKARPPL